ncbi:MAG: hypothetical protein GF353_26200 [Candidatus Lokiarchaeota archaeon]|nr:hypothetical protein [Candidatus Lokiarchaeota archaeon]
MIRLISREKIPDSLWNNDSSVMYLPPQLISCWIKLLDKYNLREKALQCSPDGFEGGMSKEDTDNHLAWKFTGSCARIIQSMIDPHEKLSAISDTFLHAFSGNRVFMADLPCGSGAASLSILSVLCELRRKACLPRMPLEVIIIGGEISTYAQDYAKEALDLLRYELEAQAIKVEFHVRDWDACDRFSNADLIKDITLKSQYCATKLLMLANFSGFLQRKKKWNEAKKQFEELFRHSRDANCIALWIEPQKNNVIKQGGFILRLLEWFKQWFSEFMISQTENKEYKSNVEVKRPLNAGNFRNHLVVVRFNLPSRNR